MTRTARELDELVYRKVLGGKLCRHVADRHGKCKRCGLNKSFWNTIAPPFRYTIDAAADYSVLVHVRENWSVEKQRKFCDLLMERYAGRRLPLQLEKEWAYLEIEYCPGDYSLTALETLGIEAPDVLTT